MSTLYYSKYKEISDSVREASELEHSLGRTLLLAGLKDIYGLRYNFSDESALISLDNNGKPHLKNHPEIHFNISHCTGLVVCAFDSHPIGVDAELVGYFPEVLIKRALSDSEKEMLRSSEGDENLRLTCFWRLWTLKEAYVKRTATGVDTDLKAFSFDFDPKMVLSEEPSYVKCSDSTVSCFQMMLKSGHIISVCTERPVDASLLDIIEYVNS